MNLLDQLFDLVDLNAPCENLGKRGSLLPLVDDLDVFNQLIEAIHDALSEVETHFSVALLEGIGERLRVTVVGCCFGGCLYSLDDVAHGFFSIVEGELLVELLPELLSLFLELVFLDGDTAEREDGQLVEEEGFGPEFPLFVEHANFVGGEGEGEHFGFAGFQDGAGLWENQSKGRYLRNDTRIAE